MLNKTSNFLCWLVALLLVNSFTKVVSIDDRKVYKHQLENHHLRLSSSRVCLLSIVKYEHKSLSYNNPYKFLLVIFQSPLVKDKELTTVSMGIFEEIILNILADYMKFTYQTHLYFQLIFTNFRNKISLPSRYEIIPPTDILTLGFLQANGSWTGTTGQLQRKVVYRG
jgi:hypothetical protein